MHHIAPSLTAALLITMAVSACASDDHAKPTSSTQTQPAAAGGKTYTMQDAGRNILRLTAPADAPCELSNGAFDMKSRDGWVNIWLVRDARTIDEGTQQAPSRITSEFKEFRATSTTMMALPDGSKAVRMLGTGLEADDNDPGKADVIVFQKAGRIFIACTHGESMRTSAQDLMVKLVQSATAP